MRESVSIILPTYDERENISHLIPELEHTFRGYAVEIIVVDDGSPDGTAAAAETIGRSYGNVRVIQRGGRKGLGSALRSGYDAARHEVLISCDADGSFSAADLLRLAQTVEQGYDLVLGSRHAVGGRYDTPHWTIRTKYFVSWLGNWILRSATGLSLHDFSGNCRAIQRRIWRTIETTEQTNALLLEMILRVAACGGRITEIPVTFADRRYGTSKLNLWVEIPKFLIVMWRHLPRHWIAPKPLDSGRDSA